MNRKRVERSRVVSYLLLIPLILLGILSILATGGGGGGSLSGGGGLGGGGGFVGGSTPYDTFGADTIDRTKWADSEFIRRIKNGALELALRRFGSNGSNNLNVIDPDAVDALQADVTVTAVSNTNAEARARIVGDFYNDGTPGTGLTGDVLASAQIVTTGTGLLGRFRVWRCDDLDCIALTTLLVDDTTIGAVALGETHTLSVAWDGTLFTFGVDGVIRIFDPTADLTAAAPPVSKPRQPYKYLGTRVSAIDGPDEGASIAATFDNVVVNGSLYDNFASAMIDRTKWTDLELVRQINKGALESTLRRFGSDGSNNLNVIDPDSVGAIQAKVTVTAVSNTNAEARAGVMGDFYNDGTPGDGFIGDVLASTEIRDNGSELVVALVVVRCNDMDCLSFTTIEFDDTTFSPVGLGETHTLSVAWSGAVFTFGVDGVTTTFDPRAAAHVAGPPRAASCFKGLGTQVSGITAPEEGAAITARFDDVRVGSPPRAPPRAIPGETRLD
jgi:hypothetical protein